MVNPDLLYDLLCSVEWQGEDNTCPQCGYGEMEGHNSDCALKAMMGELEEEG